MNENTISNENLNEFGYCTKEKCNIKEKSCGILVCRKCTREVHYACSKLPLYQIQLCLTSKSRSFQCQNCVKVPELLREKFHHEEKGKLEKLEKEIAACENIIKVQAETISRLVKQSKESNSVEKKIEHLKTSFENSLNNKIKDLGNIIVQKFNENKNIDSSNKEPNKTYSEVTRGIFTEESFRKVLKEENNRIKNEDQAKELTKCNLIIKHIYDPANDCKTKAEIQERDKRSIRKLLKDLKQENIEPLYISRVGKPPTPSNRRPRPIKIVLKNEKEKKDILDSVKLLKNMNDIICITEDLTWEERQMKKEWFKKANEMNEKEDNDDIKWCVRGCPRTKLYLKKIVLT